jgi:mRNA-degrading endonuclease RelE of RelBE toxin-antitoxin system
MSFDVRTIPAFEKDAKKLAKKYSSLKSDLRLLIQSLEENPEQGISLGNDFYKVRLAISSKRKGKSGGARVITCLKIVSSRVYLAAIYDKSEKSTITDAELKFLARQIASL